MAIDKGNIRTSANYDVKAQKPLDGRAVRPAKGDLIKKESWSSDGNTVYVYEGMQVYVQDEKKTYYLKDLSKMFATDFSGWELMGTGAAAEVEVVDSLDSEDTTAALSANQGRVLKEMIWDCPTSTEFIATLREATGALLIYDEASFLRWWEAFCNLLKVTANAPLSYIFDVVGFYLIDYVQGLTDAGEIEIQYNKGDKRYSRIYNTNTGEVISTSEIATGGGGIDESVLDEYTPLIRDFSDDFNNDFTR